MGDERTAADTRRLSFREERVARLAEGGGVKSALAQAVGSKGYHAEDFAEGPYPVE